MGSARDTDGAPAEVAELPGLCPRCRLRISGCRSPHIYRQDQPEPDDEVSAKKAKVAVCICCLGLLQPEFWSSSLNAIESQLARSGYDSDTFACGLSFPASVLIREHSIQLHVRDLQPSWRTEDMVPLKQAWKWSFGELMATTIGKTLDSGAISQFLITVHTKYKDDLQELESLKSMTPQVFVDRLKSHKKYRGEDYSRISIENILSKVDVETFKKHFNCPPNEPIEPVECTLIECSHNPVYMGGRYIKFSRELSQTPWIVDGKRIMEGSIQEIIFKPIVEFYKFSIDDDNRLKFLSSGREDVDVRCLGNGRPFAVEINNPTITKLTCEQLQCLTDSMNAQPNLMKVKCLQFIHRNDLQLLKKGEETKTKSYEALCIKLDNEVIAKKKCSTLVTQDDIDTINNYSNYAGEAIVELSQKTPLRVLHRRPLLTRSRKIYKMQASYVKDKPSLFSVELTTQAGTYIKEFIHGDFGRTTPSLSQILGFKVDILALDVKSVNLDWPNKAAM